MKYIHKKINKDRKINYKQINIRKKSFITNCINMENNNTNENESVNKDTTCDNTNGVNLNCDATSTIQVADVVCK